MRNRRRCKTSIFQDWLVSILAKSVLVYFIGELATRIQMMSVKSLEILIIVILLIIIIKFKR